MILFLIGLVSGIVSGMGIGGGAILIPTLFIFTGAKQHILQSVSLLFFIPTATIALIVHIRNKNINFKLALSIIIFGFVGVYFGSKLAIQLPGEILKKWFGVFLLLMGVYELFRKGKKRVKNPDRGRNLVQKTLHKK
jgi:uncharacterized protein